MSEGEGVMSGGVMRSGWSAVNGRFLSLRAQGVTR